jgi:chromosome segregation ATPase
LLLQDVFKLSDVQYVQILKSLEQPVGLEGVYQSNDDADSYALVISIDDESSGQAAVGAAATLAAAGTFGGFAYASRLKFKQLQQLNADIDNKTAANMKLGQENADLVEAVKEKKANLKSINDEIMVNQRRASDELAATFNKFNALNILNSRMTSETENMKLEHDRLLQNLQTDSQALKLLKSENEQVQQTMKLLKDELEAKKQTLNEVDARLAGHAELDREIREKTAKKQDLENQQQNLTQLVVQMQGVILSREQQLGNINAQIMELKDDVEKLEDKKKTLTNENASLAYEQRGIVRKNNDLEAYQARLNELTYGAKVKYRDSIIQPAFGPRH